VSFYLTRDVPAYWQADLDRLHPGENVSRLVLHWYAGFRYDPVQRWAIWEVLPATHVGKILEDEKKRGAPTSLTRSLWDAVQGPDPRTVGKWVKGRWHSDSLVSRAQWDLHKQTGGLPFLCWIIEGRHGGHAWQFGMFEQAFLLSLGTSPDLVQALVEAWPNPGSLPYAEYDSRVFHALAERDLLAQWRKSLAWEDRANRTEAGLILDGEKAQRREDMMMRTLRWLDGQIGDAVSDIPRKLLPQWSDFQQSATAAPDEAAAATQILENP